MMQAKTIYSKVHPGKYALCIDWETTGSNFGGDSTIDYQGIAFGAIIFDTETLEPVDTLYREIQFDATKYKWTTGAEKIHGLSQEYLAANGVTRQQALEDLLNMILKWIGTESKIMFCGHNVDFDICFTQQLCKDFGIDINVHHVKMETSGAAFILIGKYKSDDVFEFFTGVKRDGAHNALDDAMITLETARNMRALITAALEG
jgi:DNA polymerase III epsilon subunit-like protein